MRTFLVAAEVFCAPGVVAHGPVGVLDQGVVVRAFVARADVAWKFAKQYSKLDEEIIC